MFQNPFKAPADRSWLKDEEYYAIALQETESGIRRDGIWAMAIIQANGRDDLLKPIYLRLLVETIKQEVHADWLEQQRAAAITPPRSMPAPPLASIKPGREFYYMIGDKEVGPVTGKEMKKLANRLPASTRVRTPAMDGWSDILRMSPILDSI